MAIPIPYKGKTVKVRSNVTTGGMEPGQIAEVDDTTYTRNLIAAELWTLILTADELAALKPAPKK
jgi:hypothetical protein